MLRIAYKWVHCSINLRFICTAIRIYDIITDKFFILNSIFDPFDDLFFFVIIGYWVFGAQFCDTWVAFDVMCSTASILNLCAISLDRYIHIKDPLR